MSSSVRRGKSLLSAWGPESLAEPEGQGQCLSPLCTSTSCTGPGRHGAQCTLVPSPGLTQAPDPLSPCPDSVTQECSSPSLSPGPIPSAFSQCLSLVGPTGSETSVPLWHPSRTCSAPVTNRQSTEGITSLSQRQHSPSLSSPAPPGAQLLSLGGTARMSGLTAGTKLPRAGTDSLDSFS